MSEMIHHPQHYNMGKIEVIDVIEEWKLGFNDGNAVKYIARHKHKLNPAQDLQKAWWYLTRELLVHYEFAVQPLVDIMLTIKKDQPKSG